VDLTVRASPGVVVGGKIAVGHATNGILKAFKVTFLCNGP
jgi:hypothetical protein